MRAPILCPEERSAKKKRRPMQVEVLEERILLAATLNVFEPDIDQVLPNNGRAVNTYSEWHMSLEAQVTGMQVSSIAWNYSAAPDITPFSQPSGQNTYNFQFTWIAFQGTTNTDVITVTATGLDGTQITESYNFMVAGDDAPSWTPAPPTSAATWPNVIAPDQLKTQATETAGPYAVTGLVDGSVQTSHALPSYNSNVAPFKLDYNSAAADPQPIFLVRYQLDPSASLPAQVTAQIAVTDQSDNTVYQGPVTYFDPSRLNPGDWMQMALPVDVAGLPGGRYNWQVEVTAGTDQADYNGGFNFVTGSTAANSLTTTPFGPGWSPDGIDQLWPVQGGVIVQQPDGTSLWFAQNADGSYTSPAGDYSTLTYDSDSGDYTRTLKGGTRDIFNAAGQQLAVVDRNGNTTSYSWNQLNELTSITDMNGQVVTLSYNDGYATSVVDPASRSLTLSYNDANQLATLTDPDGTPWNYAYNVAGQLTSLGDPTSFGYGAGNLVSSVTLPNGGVQSLVPAQTQGLAAAGTGTASNPAPAVGLAAATALFTDADGNTSQFAMDGLGFGQPQQAITATASTTSTNFDANGNGWLNTDASGNTTFANFNAQGNVVCLVCPSMSGDDG